MTVLVHYNLYAYKCTYKQICSYIYIKSLYSMYNIYQDSIYNIHIELNDIFKKYRYKINYENK